MEPKPFAAGVGGVLKEKINPISAPLPKIQAFFAKAFSNGLYYRSIKVQLFYLHIPGSTTSLLASILNILLPFSVSVKKLKGILGAHGYGPQA